MLPDNVKRIILEEAPTVKFKLRDLYIHRLKIIVYPLERHFRLSEIKTVGIDAAPPIACRHEVQRVGTEHIDCLVAHVENHGTFRESSIRTTHLECQSLGLSRRYFVTECLRLDRDSTA